ncbi:RING finger protein 17-like isoform X2 [Diabrotica undecimpunctata]|uniref:RING finger protein 17-like isoform X2 n=1 Tax=Diabrotica undecimpunctata TaxID=50387 RepID=UPI003B6401ED
MNSFLNSQPGPSRPPSGTNTTNSPRARLRLRPNHGPNLGFANDYDYQNQQQFSKSDMNRGFTNHRGSQNYTIYPSGVTFPPYNFNPNQGKQNEQSNNRYNRGKRDYHKNKPPNRPENRTAKRSDNCSRQDVPHQGPTSLREKKDIQEVSENFKSPSETMTIEGAHCKLYKCPNCLLLFDCITRLNSVVGRVPLILTCQHTVCQECIPKMAKNHSVVCPICKDTSKLPTGYKYSNLQDTFSPNFFLVGTILWLKSYGNNRSNISLAPVTGTDLKSEIISPISSSISKHNAEKTCCFLTCNKNATIQCTECNDFYCEQCCNTIHKSAKSMWSHNRVPFEGNVTKKETLELERCANHNMHIEFYCTTCRLEVCCYCYIEHHDGHKKENLLKLEEDELEEFKIHKENARKILKQLIFSQKKLEDLSTSSTDSIEAEVTNYFLNLHAKLQYIQNNLKDDITRSTTLGTVKDDIKATYTEIVNSIENLKDIIIACDKVEVRKMNMRALSNKLKDVQKTPCYLLSDKKLDTFEFFVDPLVDVLENYFSIDKNDAFEIKLVSEEDLPPDYEKDETDGQYQNDVENIIGSLGKSTISTNKDKSKKSSSKNSTGMLEQESVEVTHIESLECFYVQLNKNQKQFMQMNNDIKDFIKLGPAMVDEPEINQLYLVKVLKEKIWCRGRVTDIETGKDGTLYNVFLIDYGSRYTLDKSKLRKMHVSLALQKPFAIQCQLSNPSMRNWAKNAHVYMAKILNGRKVTMTVKNEHSGVQEVDLMILTSDRSQTSVVDYLIHACTNALSNNDDTEIISPQKFSLNGPYKIFPNSVKFKKSQEANVRLASVIDPHHIFIHMASHIKFLEKMNNSLKNSYKNSKEDVCVPIEGTYVVVNYKDQIRGNWHRGLVLKVNTDDCHVSLVDWGLDLTVPWRDIRMLQEEFTRLEIQSIAVRLAQVEPFGKHTTWTDAATTFLEKFYLSQDILKIIVHNVQPLEVGLFEMVGDVDICINAQLVLENLADSTGKISQTLEWPKNDAVSGFREDDGILAQRLKQIESDDESDEEKADKIVKQKIEVVKLVHPGLIYIKFPAFESQAMQLHEELQIHYTKERKTKSSWKPDEQCVVFHNLSFARAKVLEKLDDRKYRVNIFDRATEDVINVDKMYEFDKYFTKFANVVFKSHLANIKPAGGDKWSLSSIEALESVFNKYKEICGAKVEGDLSGKSIPMNMWYTKVKIAGALEPSIMKFISLSNLLVKMGVAYKTSTSAVKSESGSVKSERSIVSSKVSNGNLSGLENDDLPANESATSVESLLEAIPKNKPWSDAVEEEEETLRAVKHASDSLDAPQEVEMEDWLPAFRIKQKEFYAWVTCVDPGGVLYLREEKLQSAYKEMETKIKEYFDKRPSDSTYNDWDAGDLCTIHYNNMYYRGKVVEVKSQDDISVIMIDFGSDHTVTSKDLKQEILYADIPAFASKIKLDKIYAKSGEWLDSDYQTFLENVSEYSKIIIKSSLDDEIPTAEVFTDKKVNLNQLLVQLCDNLTRKLPNDQSKSEDDDILIEDDEPIIEEEDVLEKGAENLLVAGNQSVDTTKYKYNIHPLPDGEKNVAISILSILEYNKIALKETSTLSEELQYLNNEIQKTVHLQPVIENLETGMPCVCQFSEDKLWYRAEVYNMEGLDCGFVFVIFVDFGNVQPVTATEIKMMRPEWFATPVACHIAGLNIKIVEDKNIEHVTNFMKTIPANQFAKILTKDPLCVSLHNKNGDLSYDNLIQKKLVEIV